MKKNYLLLSLALCTSGLYAQFAENWHVRFQTTPSPNYSNEGRKVAVDASSNIFVLGDYSSDKDSTGHGTTTTQYSVRLQKYSFNGVLLTWDYIPVNGLVNNGFDNRSGFGLELDAGGNVYIGYSVLNASGNFDVVITKYSNNLVILWTRTYATGANDVGVDMKLYGAAAIAIVKSYTGGSTVYSVVSANTVSSTMVLVYSFTANVDVVNALTSNGTKDIFVTGYSLSSGVKTVMTADVTTTGSLKWKTNYNHNSVTGDDYGNGIMAGSDGFIYVVGTTYTNAANGNDGVILKYNTGGVLKNFLLLNHTATDVGYAVAQGPSGYIFAACANVTTVNVYKIQSSATVFVQSTHSFYNPIPASPYTSITNVTVSAMKVAASNNVYVCGNVDATSAAGNFSASFLEKSGFSGLVFTVLNRQPVEGSFNDNYRPIGISLDGYKADILILRNYWANNTNHANELYELNDLDGGVTLRLSNDAVDNSISDVSVFPNPATDRISVRANEEITSIEICDLTGQVVKSVRVNATADADVNIAGLREGLYVCKVITASGAVTLKKLMIQ